MLDEHEFLSPYGIRSHLPLPRRAPVHLPRRPAGIPRVLPARRVRQRHVRRQFQLARPDLDAGERADRARAAPGTTRTTATASRSSARPGSGPLHDAVPGGGGAVAAAERHLPEGRARAPAACMAAPTSSRKTRTGATSFSSTSTSTATTARVSVRRTRRGGPGIVARMMHLFASTSARDVLEKGKMAPATEQEPVPVRG